MGAPLTFHLVRHGEVHNPERIYYGRLPGYQLSATGRQQAIAAGQYLKDRPLVVLYASPMERAQETAQLIVQQREIPLPIITEERLIEVHSPYDGVSHDILEPINFDHYTGTQAPYEQPGDIRRRVRAFIADMRRTHAGQEIAAVSHGDVVVAMFMFAMQQEEHDIGRGRLDTLGLPERYPMTASINTFTYQTDDDDEIPLYQYHRPY
jgi:broad specificity phosphatase PhoE